MIGLARKIPRDDVALQRIDILYRLARDSAVREPDLSASYIRLMKRISTKYRRRLDGEIKRNICASCGRVLLPNTATAVRISGSNGYIIVRCGCGKERHIFYKRRS